VHTDHVSQIIRMCCQPTYLESR